MKNLTKKSGSELKVGDTLLVIGGPDTITGLRKYTGPLSECFQKGAQVASFARAYVGMTIDNDADYEIVVPV